MDFEHARYNMIEQQIRPWHVLDADVLELLQAIRREDFVPPAYRSLAFTDMELPLNLGGVSTGEAMFAPKTEARVLQELNVRRHESVLEIGAGSGFMAALLAHRSRHVTSLEIREDLARFANENLHRAGVVNATIDRKDGSDPQRSVGDAHYDVIVFSGSVAFVPDNWLDRLNPNGRLFAIVGSSPVMEARLIERATDGALTTRNLFETQARRLSGFAERDGFRF